MERKRETRNRPTNSQLTFDNGRRLQWRKHGLTRSKMNRPVLIWAKREDQDDLMEVSRPADEGGHLQPSWDRAGLPKGARLQ